MNDVEDLRLAVYHHSARTGRAPRVDALARTLATDPATRRRSVPV